MSLNYYFQPIDLVDQTHLQMSEVSLYSTTPWREANFISRIIMNFYEGQTPLLTPVSKEGLTLTDATANVGGNTISFYLSGIKWINAVELNEKITLQKEDVCSMSFADETFDAATTSFGIRNFDKLDESIREVHRVLKPQGKFVILEMSEPKTPSIHLSYLLYTRTLIPLAVKTFSNDPLAYKYLTDSMKVFPQGKEMIAILEKNGFKCLKHKTFFLGVCSLYLVEKV